MDLSALTGQPTLIPANYIYEVSTSFTILGTTTNPTPGTIQMQRVTERNGRYANIRYEIYQNSAGTAGSGTYLLPMPAGLNIDYTRQGGTAQTNGNSGFAGNGAFSIGAAVYPCWASTANTGIYTNAFAVIYDTAAADALAWGSTNGALTNTTIRLGINIRVPIVGWDENIPINAGITPLASSLVPGYQDSGWLPMPTITWQGTTAPSSLLNSGYRWIKIGRKVSLKWIAVYNTQGAASINALWTLPSTVPPPSQAFSGSQWSVIGTGGLSLAPSNTPNGLSMIDSSSGVYTAYSSGASGVYKTMRGEVEYFTDI